VKVLPVHPVKAHRWSRGIAPLTLKVACTRWVVSLKPGRFNPDRTEVLFEQKAVWAYREILDVFGKGANLTPTEIRNPDLPVRSIVTVTPTLSRFLVSCLQAYFLNSKTNETERLKCLMKVRGRKCFIEVCSSISRILIVLVGGHCINEFQNWPQWFIIITLTQTVKPTQHNVNRFGSADKHSIKHLRLQDVQLVDQTLYIRIRMWQAQEYLWSMSSCRSLLAIQLVQWMCSRRTLYCPTSNQKTTVFVVLTNLRQLMFRHT